MPNERIEELTPEQDARLDEWFEMWTAIGLSCDPCDVDRAKAGVIEAYRVAELDPPKEFIVCDGPIEAAYEAARRTGGGKNPTPSRAAKELNNTVSGSHDAGWLSFYDYFRVVVGMEECDELIGLIEVAKSCGWWMAYSDFVILQHRHEHLHLDDRGQPHSEHGPAISYRDGLKLWAWHGVTVPQRVIESPETLTIEEIKQEGDAEVRRVMRERYGEDKYLHDTGAKIIDVDHEGARKGAAPRCLIEDDEGRRFLVATDGSTSRVYYMEVPPETQTCAQAHESLCGFNETIILAKS